MNYTCAYFHQQLENPHQCPPGEVRLYEVNRQGQEFVWKQAYCDVAAELVRQRGFVLVPVQPVNRGAGNAD